MTSVFPGSLRKIVTVCRKDSKTFFSMLRQSFFLSLHLGFPKNLMENKLNITDSVWEEN